MEIDSILQVKNRKELRNWLKDNCESMRYCWIIVSIKPETDKILYLDAVEEALCFGWIDGVKKKSDDNLIQRLSPRSKNSNWTELNKERVRRLNEKGLMTRGGKSVLPNMEVSSFVIYELIEKRLKEDPIAYKNFRNFPDLYKRVRIDTIQSVKKQEGLYNKRIDKFIENTKKNIMYGSWHDNGRLLK